MTFSSVVVLLGLLCGANCWVNDWDDPFEFECPDGRYISVFQSDHANNQEDRRFDFQCSDYVGDTNNDCEWTGWLNTFDDPFQYSCPDSFFLSGIESEHDNDYEDRRFSVQCCRVPDFIFRDCGWTPYINTWDESIFYVLDDDRIMAGLGSEHDNDREDRRFRFYECDYPGARKN